LLLRAWSGSAEALVLLGVKVQNGEGLTFTRMAGAKVPGKVHRVVDGKFAAAAFQLLLLAEGEMQERVTSPIRARMGDTIVVPARICPAEAFSLLLIEVQNGELGIRASAASAQCCDVH